jgi:hypothetical protein
MYKGFTLKLKLFCKGFRCRPISKKGRIQIYLCKRRKIMIPNQIIMAFDTVTNKKGFSLIHEKIAIKNVKNNQTSLLKED